MPERTGIKMYHPETGVETLVQHERQARILERSGWQRGAQPEATLSDSTESLQFQSWGSSVKNEGGDG